ncbi:hypothetical protein K402DRAFT_456465 [Aulographum hederae CBS 113979]|uniref:Zinc transporter n=1 Tax=Aulographum hederae CBS 113979 TaxID=1176131 RepID=A0A6G1GS37_9PEZI|nr:hypothetical protein K402DRAFT_456465 [Aulographum hederae CBS 113979]
MASSDMPTIVAPPQTPPDEPRNAPESPAQSDFNPDALSPLSSTFPPPRYGSLNSMSPTKGALSPATSGPPYSPIKSGSENESLSASDGVQNPFNFQTVQYTAGKSPGGKPDTVLGRRRGHKYKHSSVSHQIFLEPAPRTPLQLPTSLPIPTFSEFRSSMSIEQKLRGLWCFCHLFVAGYVQWSAQGSLAITSLSHLLFFDALGAFLCVAVDVGSNFEVWKRSSISHPFGLERSEVLAGLAMAVGLLFMGLDLISHGLTHALENQGGHESHHAHSHARVSPGSVDLAALLAILATLVSAISLKNHARIGRVMRFAVFEHLPSVLSNPSHLLTLSCSALLLLLPLLSIESYKWLDAALSATIAVSMVSLGARLCFILGRMLLMSYSGPGVEPLIREIEDDPTVVVVEEAKFWQVHYGLCMANLKLLVKNRDDQEALRERIVRLVRHRLGGAYGTGGAMRWEVSTQLDLDRN